MWARYRPSGSRRRLSMQVIPGFTELNSRRTRWMQIFGRLQSGMTAKQAQAGLQPWFKAMLDEDTRRPDFPNITAERRARFLASTLTLIPAPQGHSSMRRTMERPLRVMFGATAVLLALACLNVAGLFLARGSARMREVHTRPGAGRLARPYRSSTAGRQPVDRTRRRGPGACTGAVSVAGTDRVSAPQPGRQCVERCGGRKAGAVHPGGECRRRYPERPHAGVPGRP